MTAPDSRLSAVSGHRSALRAMRGFSMPEVMGTLAIVAITSSLAAPAMGELLSGNRMASEANTLIGALNYARSEAVGAARDVSLCPYTVVAGESDPDNRYRCADQLDWSAGWMVLRPEVDEAGIATGGQQVLKLFGAAASGNQLTATSNRIDYLPTGFIDSTASTVFTLKTPDCRHPQQRSITLSMQGRPHVATTRCAS